MLDRPHEYQKMAEVEKELWWYKSLHELVIGKINGYFKRNRNIAILDAGCGTGGLMISLINAGYENVCGFDLSVNAVQFCEEKKLNVKNLNIKDVAQHYSPHSFEVIICNDVLYFLNEQERYVLFKDFKSLLKTGGIFISNVPALDAFRGMHDISVGIQKRFTRPSFINAINQNDFSIQKILFWPFFLSPIIYFTRLVQRIALSLNKNKKIESDIDMPSNIVNQALYWITAIENKFISWKPFGSSLFVILKRK